MNLLKEYDILFYSDYLLNLRDGFDPSHKKCIDENYIRISCGYDFTDASPIKGVKLNFSGIENLSFKLDINSVQ